MPHPCLLEVSSRSEGPIKGSAYLYGKSRVIAIYGIEHSVGLTIRRFDGYEPLDRLTNAPLTVFKEVDASSPVLYQHLTSCDLLEKVTLRYYTTDAMGNDINFYSVVMDNVIITRITPETKTAFLPSNEPYRHMESVSFSYKSIRWVDEINSRETSDTTFLLHDYGDEKKLLSLGSLLAPAAPLSCYPIARSRSETSSNNPPIKTGIFDTKSGESIQIQSKNPASSQLNANNQYDTINKNSDAQENKILLIELQDHAKARAAELKETLSTRQRGPVLTVLKDKKTGEIFEGMNTDNVAQNLHPVLAKRLEIFNQNFPTPDVWPHPSKPGTHSEINALNKALNAREATGVQVSERDMSDFVLYNETLWKTRNGSVPCCANCTQLLDNVESLSGKLDKYHAIRS